MTHSAMSIAETQSTATTFTTHLYSIKDNVYLYGYVCIHVYMYVYRYMDMDEWNSEDTNNVG